MTRRGLFAGIAGIFAVGGVAKSATLTPSCRPKILIDDISIGKLQKLAQAGDYGIHTAYIAGVEVTNAMPWRFVERWTRADIEECEWKLFQVLAAVYDIYCYEVSPRTGPELFFVPKRPVPGTKWQYAHYIHKGQWLIKETPPVDAYYA